MAVPRFWHAQVRSLVATGCIGASFGYKRLNCCELVPAKDCKSHMLEVFEFLEPEVFSFSDSYALA